MTEEKKKWNSRSRKAQKHKIRKAQKEGKQRSRKAKKQKSREARKAENQEPKNNPKTCRFGKNMEVGSWHFSPCQSFLYFSVSLGNPQKWLGSWVKPLKKIRCSLQTMTESDPNILSNISEISLICNFLGSSLPHHIRAHQWRVIYRALSGMILILRKLGVYN
jgi:hypothetical protein